jgi:hypothetical protein
VLSPSGPECPRSAAAAWPSAVSHCSRRASALTRAPLCKPSRLAMSEAVGYPCRPSRAYHARRVVRGGSYWNQARNCRSAYRNANEPGNRNRNLGFRLAAAHSLAGLATDPALEAPEPASARPSPLRVLVGASMRARTLPERRRFPKRGAPGPMRAVERKPRNVQRSTFNVQRSTFNVQRSTFNVQRSTFNVQRSTLNVQRSTFNAQRSTLNAQRSTLNVQRTPGLNVGR